MCVVVAVALAGGIFAFAGAAAFIGSWGGRSSVGVLAAGLIGWVLWKRELIVLDESGCTRGLKIISALGTLVALGMLARVAVFMADPTKVGFSLIPSSPWEREHSCVSAYYVAGKAASSTPNIYDSGLFTAPDDDLTKPRKPAKLGAFRIDVFEYPPPFLVVPRALRLVAPEFLSFRSLWFGLTGVVILLGLLLVARALGPVAGTRAVLLAPLVLAAMPTVSALQKGNVQLLVIALAMLAMLLFQRKHRAAGGALLAYATVSKLFPGMLVVYLMARREWRAVIWTAAFSVALVVVAMADIGWRPYVAFLHHLPGVLGGEAFPAFRMPATVAINFSLPGLVFKAKLFGVAGMTFGVSKAIGWAYTVILLAVTVLVGLRRGKTPEAPLVWLTILLLATLRSPFLPQAYASFPPLWLLTLLAAVHAPTVKTLSLLVLGWLALAFAWPIDQPIDPRLLASLNFIPQALTVALAVLALRPYRQAAGRVP
jgi:alpha-1,2-mannosyltransferase